MKILNKRAKFDYALLEKLEAGISLTGAEAKAAQNNRVNLSSSYVKIINDEAYLINASIQSEDKSQNPTRTRKLLVHKNQIISLKTKIKAKRLTIVPTKMYNKGRLIKLEIALAKPKKKFDKRQEIKKRDLERELREALKFQARKQ